MTVHKSIPVTEHELEDAFEGCFQPVEAAREPEYDGPGDTLACVVGFGCLVAVAVVSAYLWWGR